MFKSILREVVENADGAIASILMGFDGITVESFANEGSASTGNRGREYSQVLQQVKQARRCWRSATRTRSRSRPST